MCEVLKVMDAHGFELLTSIDVNVGAQSDTITDSGCRIVILAWASLIIIAVDTWIFASKM